MNTLLIVRTGLVSVLTFVPLLASAASSYCGERVCHAYDSNGACSSWTCYGDGYYDGYYGGYRDPNYSSRYDRYPYDYRYSSDYRGYDYAPVRYRESRSMNRNYYYGYNYSRPVRSSYYRDDYYYPRYDDRIYVPKAGYYYRY